MTNILNMNNINIIFNINMNINFRNSNFKICICKYFNYQRERTGHRRKYIEKSCIKSISIETYT